MPTRRSLLHTAAAAVPAILAVSASAQPAAPALPAKIPLGFDNFSIRSLGWKAGQILDYAGALQVDCLLLSDLDVYESHDAAYLSDLARKARDLGISIQAGTGGICPSAHRFSNKWGNADEHMALCLKLAKHLGSKVLRCYQGFGEDRRSPGGIPARQKDTIEVCRKARNQAMDAGIRIAIENHAGDMQAWELQELVEACGKEFVGVTIDSGNATWTLEDPLLNLEILAPYVVTSGMRDSMIWEDEKGVQVQWTAMGEGLVDWKTYVQQYAMRCPDAPFVLEIISGGPRAFPWKSAEFWKGYERVRASEFARFLNLSRRGKPIPAWQPASGEDRRKAEQNYQKSELEKSLAFCRNSLGLGLK